MPSFKVLVPRVPLGATRVFEETLRWAWKDGHGVMGCSIQEGMVHLWKLHTFKDAPCPLGVGRLLNDIQKHQHVNASVTQRPTSIYQCNKEYRILEEATQTGADSCCLRGLLKDAKHNQGQTSSASNLDFCSQPISALTKSLSAWHEMHDSAVAVLIQCVDNATMRF